MKSQSTKTGPPDEDGLIQIISLAEFYEQCEEFSLTMLDAQAHTRTSNNNHVGRLKKEGMKERERLANRQTLE